VSVAKHEADDPVIAKLQRELGAIVVERGAEDDWRRTKIEETAAIPPFTPKRSQ
jgi:hypothetical protein